MASKQHDAVMAAIPGGNVDHNDPIEVVRDKMHAIHPNSASPGTIVDPIDLDGVEAKWIYTPENADSDRVVLHVHGGAFVSTVIDHYLSYGEILSRKIGCKVVCFQWTWADEAPYPAAMNDTLTAFRALVAKGIDPSRIAFAGDSCGRVWCPDQSDGRRPKCAPYSNRLQCLRAAPCRDGAVAICR